MASSKFNFSVSYEPSGPEMIKLRKSGLKAVLNSYTGQQGEFMVTIIPSLNVTGYGRTEREAIESIRENLDTLFHDLFDVSEVERHKYLTGLGWIRNEFFKHQMSSTFVDENGVLQNFDFPDQVKKTTLQAA